MNQARRKHYDHHKYQSIEHPRQRTEEEQHRFKSCTRKHRFPTKAAAPASQGFKVYRCRFCKGWHITKTRSMKRRILRAVEAQILARR